MPDDPGSRLPRTPVEKLVVALLTLALASAFLAEVLRDGEPRKLAAVFFVLAWGPLLVLHEGGHAVAAALVGFRIERVVLGFGARRAALSVRGVPVEVRSFPVTGFVSTTPRAGRGSRLAHAFVYAAGPGAELLVAGAIAALVGPERLFVLTDDLGLLALQAVAAAAATGAVTNLFPGSAGGAHGDVPTDGLGILRALFGGR